MNTSTRQFDIFLYKTNAVFSVHIFFPHPSKTRLFSFVCFVFHPKVTQQNFKLNNQKAMDRSGGFPDFKGHQGFDRSLPVNSQPNHEAGANVPGAKPGHSYVVGIGGGRRGYLVTDPDGTQHLSKGTVGMIQRGGLGNDEEHEKKEESKEK
jgi:hypothetical protein